MADQNKYKKMWRDLDGMEEDVLMKELQNLHVNKTKEEILQKLQETYNDLAVSDWIFATCTVDDSQSDYPKEFVDEAVTRLARLNPFPFTHYGIISQDLFSLQHAMINEDERLQKQGECFQRLFHLCKRFQLTFFDHVVYTIQDELDMGKAFLLYLNQLQKHGQPVDHRLAIQQIERFFQTFDQMNPWIEEQLQYEQAESLIALKSAKGEKLFVKLIKEASDPTEAVYRFAKSYENRDPKRIKNIVSRYQKNITKDGEYYSELMALLKS